MTTQLQIYETAVPVSSARHAKCSVEPVQNHAFARQVNSILLMAVEFPEAASEYPIVFAGTADKTMPVVILGARQNENLYLDAEGQWQARYIPAFIRRYPFVFSSSEDAKTLTLCVDEAYLGVNFQGRGQALFDAEGKPTAFTDKVLQFEKEYRAQVLRTEAFCKKLRELDLLESMQAEFTLEGHDKMALAGFHVVSRERLKKLDADALADLLKTDELELIYLHLQSMRNFNALKDRLVASAASKSDAGDTDKAVSDSKAESSPEPA